MLHEEIAGRHGWVRIEPVTEGWSGEEKFHAWDADGNEYLLRIADEKSEKIMRMGFEAVQQLPDMPVPEGIEMGRAEGKVYAIFSWLEGVPLEGVLPQLDDRTQYALGVMAGRVLSEMHKLPAPESVPEWGEFFRRKIVRARMAKYGVEADFFRKHDVHIHVPEGAVPKDGPSAGVALSCALLSAVTGLSLRGDVAMTGEVTLRGNVLPIGGVKEKLLAAYRMGITNILLPRENEKDLEEIEESIREKMDITLLDTVDEAFAIMLIDNKTDMRVAV